VTYQAVVLGYTPLVYYRNKETTGTAATDTSGNAHTGTYTDVFTLNQTDSPITSDAAARSVLWDGSDGWIDAGFNPFVAGSLRTYHGWAKRTDQSNNHGFFGGTAVSTSPALWCDTGGGTIYWSPDMSAGQIAFDVGYPNDGIWHSWMLSFNATTFDALLYIDGAKNGATKNIGFGYNGSPGNWQVCGRGTYQYVWKGKLAETFVAGSILTAADALAIHNAAATGGAGGGVLLDSGFWARS
jgi:hypothetical protein